MRRSRGDMIRRRNRSSIKFTDRRIPKKSMFALAFGVIALALLIILLVLTSQAILEETGNVILPLLNPESELHVGIAGLGALGLSALGVGLSLASFRRSAYYITLPIISLSVNGVILLVTIALYVIGLVA